MLCPLLAGTIDGGSHRRTFPSRCSAHIVGQVAIKRTRHRGNHQKMPSKHRRPQCFYREYEQDRCEVMKTDVPLWKPTWSFFGYVVTYLLYYVALLCSLSAAYCLTSSTG